VNDAASSFVVGRDGALLLTLRVQPGAKKDAVAGRCGNALKIRLAAPPVDGKANAALLVFLARWLQIPKSAISLKSGQTSRQKVVRVEGVEAEWLARQIRQVAARQPR
jgi:uncharacterized protein (TIGR00251 family)